MRVFASECVRDRGAVEIGAERARLRLAVKRPKGKSGSYFETRPKVEFVHFARTAQ